MRLGSAQRRRASRTALGLQSLAWLVAGEDQHVGSDVRPDPERLAELWSGLLGEVVDDLVVIGDLGVQDPSVWRALGGSAWLRRAAS